MLYVFYSCYWFILFTLFLPFSDYLVLVEGLELSHVVSEPVVADHGCARLPTRADPVLHP